MVKNPSIGQASGERVVTPGTDVWNISDGYMKIKVLRLLIQLDLDESIASFGRKDMEEDLPDSEIPGRREEAIQRIFFSLKQLIGNVKFTIDKRDILRYKNVTERLENVGEVLDGISYIIVNDVTKENFLKINEPHFNKCLNILREVKDDLNYLLDKAGLIFKKTDEVNLDDIMKRVYEGG